MSVLSPIVSCAPPYSKVHTWEMLFGAPGCCAASLPGISWVPPTLLCFLDTTSSEMLLDSPDRLWFYLLTAAVSICQPHNQCWVQLLSLFPSLCFCYPAAVGAVLCPSIAGHGDARGALQELAGGVDEAVPPTLSPPTRRFYPAHGVRELFIPWQAGVCQWPPV